MGELLDYLINSGPQFRRARLPSLYSDFAPLRSSNPDGYSANISAWLTALQNATKAGKIPNAGSEPDRFSFATSEELLQALQTKEHGRPLALAVVVDEAVSKGQMMPYDKFQSSPYSIYDRRWTIQPSWMLSWVLRRLGVWDSAQSDGKLPNARYALIANLEEAADRILKTSFSRVNIIDRILPMEMFRQLAADTMDIPGQLSLNDTNLLLTFLNRDKKVIAYDSHTIKFTTSSESSLTPLTDQDRTISSLKTLLQSLSLQISQLETRINFLTSKAQQSLSTKNRPSALAALKSKRLAEATLTQRYATLSQVEDVYAKIEQAADQVTLVRVMEGSTGVLRSLQKEMGEVEKVEDVVEDLREEMRKVDEAGAALNEANASEAVIAGDEELDEELEAMEKQQRQEQERERKEKDKRQEEEEEKRQWQKEAQRDRRGKELEERAKRLALAPGQDERGQVETQDVDELVRSTSGLSVDDDQRRIPIAEQS